MTKRGDRYLRKQLVQGARALVSRAAKSTDPLSLWATKLRIPQGQVLKLRIPQGQVLNFAFHSKKIKVGLFYLYRV